MNCRIGYTSSRVVKWRQHSNKNL